MSSLLGCPCYRGCLVLSPAANCQRSSGMEGSARGAQAWRMPLQLLFLEERLVEKEMQLLGLCCFRGSECFLAGILSRGKVT